MFKKKKTQPAANDDFFSDEADAGATEYEPMPEVTPAKKQTPKSRLLLLLLLLVAIAGGGYYYLFMIPAVEPPPPPPPVAVRKPIPPPPPPATAPATQPAAPAQPAASAPPAAPAQVAAAPATPAAPAAPAKAAVPAAPPAPAAGKAAPAPVAAKAQPAPAAPASPAKKEAPPAAAAPSAKTVPAAETLAKQEPAAVKASAAPASGPYTVEVGAFLLKENRKTAEKTITRLGYKPKITVIQRPVKMLRLRVGGPYPPMLAEARLAEVSLFAPNAFSVPNGNEMTVYAGSFFVVDEARALADKLYAEGIRVDEEYAQMTMPLESVSFGSFASKDAAADAVAKVKKAGLSPVVVRK